SGDGSYGDPSVRITQLVKGFGDNGVSSSICDPSASYASVLVGLAARIGDHLQTVGGSSNTSGAGGSGVVGAGGAGTTLGDAGASDATGAGGTTGITGTGTSPGTGGKSRSGLMDGGCEVGSSGTGVSGLVLAGLFLLGARRRRASSGGPGAES
ncbi:MAG TPA: hypothetical protein VLA79_12900, partial [Polyangia bacterium]|nr:hypothetical protein [Polyangia bacterium]